MNPTFDAAEIERAFSEDSSIALVLSSFVFFGQNLKRSSRRTLSTLLSKPMARCYGLQRIPPTLHSLIRLAASAEIVLI